MNDLIQNAWTVINRLFYGGSEVTFKNALQETGNPRAAAQAISVARGATDIRADNLRDVDTKDR